MRASIWAHTIKRHYANRSNNSSEITKQRPLQYKWAFWWQGIFLPCEFCIWYLDCCVLCMYLVREVAPWMFTLDLFLNKLQSIGLNVQGDAYLKHDCLYNTARFRCVLTLDASLEPFDWIRNFPPPSAAPSKPMPSPVRPTSSSGWLKFIRFAALRISVIPYLSVADHQWCALSNRLPSYFQHIDEKNE